MPSSRRHTNRLLVEEARLRAYIGSPTRLNQNYAALADASQRAGMPGPVTRIVADETIQRTSETV